MGEHSGMTIPHPILRPLLAGLAAALTLNGLALAADATTAPVAKGPSSAASLMAPIQALIGDAECDHPTECHVVPVGAKACGGPSGYLAWSVKATTDQKALLTAVQAQAEAQKEENKASGLASDCRMVTAPTATCRPRAPDGKKTCQLGQGAARGLD